MIDGASGRVMTYGELDDAIRSLAGGLVAAGFRRGMWSCRAAFRSEPGR